ncbi:YggS family pyridoxal phosphate-dependent enzyme [Kutzneria sp. CA-103260]|uniref:YggS family pyridoxal phosphate-dependent enzyme n=1 Tax=Kutzneria sp. CA-103260 TaxID=2802641 RepID=UPI001BA49C06|nr:YggS family pyridoxal phosphate-dependent enzyme [Kutzneria sp. CA-103260]QUQ71707.1 pyridoxal-5'-phosphate dependent enzyme class III [Kutzneria sp. CA-103260]
MTEERRAQLEAGLADVREQIADACRAAGRSPDEVKLLAVTKTFPASDAILLAGLGVTDFAENRDQEAAPKAAEVALALPDTPVRWHMVGRMQRNKARSIVGWADEVQSVDSPRLAAALAKAAAGARTRGSRTEPLSVLIQASLDGDPERGGVPLSGLLELADEIGRSGELILRGVMGVAPLSMDPRAAFELLSKAADRVRSDHPTAVELSAGMSGDLAVAIGQGSTCVRVGTGLLGYRGLASP